MKETRAVGKIIHEIKGKNFHKPITVDTYIIVCIKNGKFYTGANVVGYGCVARIPKNSVSLERV